jgi:RHS repeat-associated protein
VDDEQHGLHTLRFPEQYYDPETDLHCNYFRYYDPESARYQCQLQAA